MTVVADTYYAAAGTDDTTFIRRLRELLQDLPRPANEQFSGVGGTVTTYQCSTIPINDDDYFTVTVGGVAVTPVYQRQGIAPGTVFVDFDTGTLIFGTPPPVGVNNIQATKTKVLYRNSMLLASLLAGLRATFPFLWTPQTDSSIVLQTLVWDYPLPPVFNDPRVKLFGIYLRPIPAASERYRPLPGAYRRGLTTLTIPSSQWFPPGSSVQIEYNAPYASLSELEPQAFNLPIWYALGQIMAVREPKRLITDSQATAAGGQSPPPGSFQNAGTFFMRQFEAELKRMQKPLPMGRTISTYQM
jgi:hypothetical protein